MSASVLNNPGKQIVIADEFESFFHVILYYAIRFLPHNLKPENIGAFLISYFDGYVSVPDGGYTCGPTKEAAVTSGTISLFAYNGGVRESLTFFIPPDTSGKRMPHPINDVLKELLKWFKAYYATQGKKQEGETNKLKGRNAAMLSHITRPNAIATSSKPQQQSGSQASGSLPPPSNDSRLSGSAAASIENTVSNNIVASQDPDIASKLNDHEAMVLLLWEYLEQGDWPEADKDLDLKPAAAPKPKKFKVKPKKPAERSNSAAPSVTATQSDTAVQSGSTAISVKTSQKRPREEDIEDEDEDDDVGGIVPEPPLAKRTRSGGRWRT